MVEDRDVHQYGDFALTKYYSPKDDQGLGGEWENFQDLVSNVRTFDFSPLLGLPLEVNGNFFDPGKMGSYFQSEENVGESLRKLIEVECQVESHLLDDIKGYKDLLEQAIIEKKGLYVTF